MSNSLARFRLITFDVTNTLLKFRSSPGKQYGEIGALFGVRGDNNDLVKNFKKNWISLNKKYPNFGCHSKLEWQEWWRILIVDTFEDSGAKIPQEKVENFTNHLIELYKTSIIWQLTNGSVDLLKYISNIRKERQTPLVMGVIANFDPRLNTLLKNMRIDHFFKFQINSYEAKTEKPNGKIFQIAMEASNLDNLEPRECLHIGDGPVTDYLAAKKLNWNAALVHEKSYSYLLNKYGKQVSADYVFPSLYDFQKKLSHGDIKW